MESKRLPLALGRVRARATGDPREVEPATDPRHAVALAAGIAKQMPLGRAPHAVGQVHRERLGHERPEMRCPIEVRIRGILERGARQAQALAHRDGIPSALAVRRPVRAGSGPARLAAPRAAASMPPRTSLPRADAAPDRSYRRPTAAPTTRPRHSAATAPACSAPASVFDPSPLPTDPYSAPVTPRCSQRAIARLKNWRVPPDHRRRSHTLCPQPPGL